MTYPIYHGITLARNAAFENLVIEQIATDPLGPDEGRIWYNSTDKAFKMSVTDSGGAQETLSFQDAEEFAAFLVDLSSTTADASGAKKIGYDGQVGGNGAFTVAGAALDVVLDSIVLAIDAEKQASADLASTAAGKGVNALGYEGKAGTEGQFSVVAGSLKSSLDSMVTQIDANALASSVSSQGLQDEIDLTQLAAGLTVDGNYVADETSNFLKSGNFTGAGKTASLKEADALLDTKAKAIDTELQAYKTSNDTAVSERLQLAGGTMSGDLNMGANSVTAHSAPTADGHLTNKAYVDSVASGLDVKKSVRVGSLVNIDIATGGFITVDDISVVDGDRVLLMGQTDPIENGIYVAAAASWSRSTDADAEAELNSGMFTFVEEGTACQNNGYVLVSDGAISVDITPLDFEQFSGAGQVIAGAGIAKNGNELFLNFGAGIIETPEDEIGIDFGAGLFTTADGMVASTDTGAKLEIKIDGDTLTKGINGLKVSDSVLEGSAQIQSELDLTQVGAGLGTDGAYAANAGSTYLTSATDLFDADQKLDVQVKATADALASEITARGDADALIQTEIDATQAGAGLGTDGAYAANAGSTYLTTATDLFDADQMLDVQLKAAADSLAQEISDRADEDTAIRTGSGLLVTGAIPDISTSTYLQGASSLFTALTDLDSAVNAGFIAAKADVSNVVTQINANQFSLVSGAPSLVHSIQHNMNAPVVDVTIWIQREDGKFYNDLALVTEETANEITVTLTSAANVKVSVEAIVDLVDPTV
jgi:hypothetical protein